MTHCTFESLNCIRNDKEQVQYINKRSCLHVSYLKLSENASTPHLERQYPPPMSESLPSMLATFTTRPRAFFSRGRNFSVTSTRPMRFTSRTFLKSSSCIQSVGPMGTEMPALLTKPHRPDTRKKRGFFIGL